MRELDDTDLEILRLLTADARRPYSEIADAVDLSPPAVSDRVSRLQNLGVIRRFTLELDRSKLQSGVAVLVDVDVRPAAVDEVRADLRDDDAVEHLLQTASSHLLAVVRVPDGAVRGWLSEVTDLSAVREYDVRLLSSIEWTPSVGGDGFSLSCDECDNTVTSEGVITRIDGTLYSFCCSSCERRFRDRYDQLSEGV